MKGVLIFLAGLIVGGAISFVVATGIGAGVGVATGLMAGACVTLETAKGKGFITPEQVDEVLSAAGEMFAAEKLAEREAVSGGDAQCQEVIAKLKSASARGN